MTDTNELTLESWLAGQTRATESVDILQDGDLSGQWVAWARKYELATADEEVNAGERSTGETSKTQDLLKEGQALLARMDAARTTWFVRGIDGDIESEIAKENPWPVNPVPLFDQEPPQLRKGATDSHAIAFRAANENYWKARAEHDQKHAIENEKYAFEVAEVAKERGYAQVAAAFVRAEQGGKTIIASLSIEGAKVLNKAVGDVEFAKILKAIEKASRESEPIPGDADFLSITSAKTGV